MAETNIKTLGEQDVFKKEADKSVAPKDSKSLFLAGIWELLFPGEKEPGSAFVAVYDKVMQVELREDKDVSILPSLSGTAQEAIQSATEFVKKRGRLPRILGLYYTKTIANTLQNWEQNAGNSMEELIDLIIMPLTRSDVRPLAGLDTLRFVAGVESALISGRLKTLGEGYVKTWGAVADWMRKSGYKIGKVWAVTCYSRLIGAVLREDSPSEKVLSVMAVDANSLASTLDDIGDRENRTLLETANRCHLLMPLYRQQPELSVAQRGLIAAVMQALLQIDADTKSPVDPLQASWMLTKIVQVSVSWHALSPAVFGSGLLDCDMSVDDWWELRQELLLLLYCVGGHARICLVEEKDFGEPVSSFFNATVQLNRLKDKVSGDAYLKVVQFRLLVGAVGLWWALRATDDVAQAMAPFNGYDCLVNLTATVAGDKQLFNETLQHACISLALQAYQYGPPTDKQRLKGSFTKLGLDTEALDSLQPAPIKQLRSATETLLDGIMQQCGMDELAIEKLHVSDLRQPVIYWTEQLQPQLESVINAVRGETAYTESTKLITQLLQNLADLKGKSPALIAEKIWGKEVQGTALLKTAQIDLPRAWWEALDAYADAPPESLADFVREYASRVFEARNQ
jgi:hypothetical protein